MDDETSSTAVARRYAEAIDQQDWAGLAALLRPDFTARLLHTGEEFDRDEYVRFNADYPGSWQFLADELVPSGERVVLRARTTDGDQTFHVAAFLDVVAGLIGSSTEVWTEAVQPVDRRPGEAGDGAASTSSQHQHHRIDYVELNVADLATSRAFYEQAFGWEFNEYGRTYAGIRTADGKGEVGGLNAIAGSASSRPAGGPLVLLFSSDLDATAEAIRAAGGKVVNGPYAFPGGRRLHFTDPSGNELGVWAD